MYVVPGSHRWELDYSREDIDVTDPEWLLKRADLPARVEPVACEVPAGHCHFHHCRTFHGSYGNKTDNPRRSYVMHLMPGHIRRRGDDWNDRMASVEGVGRGRDRSGAQLPGAAGFRLAAPAAPGAGKPLSPFFSSRVFVVVLAPSWISFYPACRSEARLA